MSTDNKSQPLEDPSGTSNVTFLLVLRSHWWVILPQIRQSGIPIRVDRHEILHIYWERTGDIAIDVLSITNLQDWSLCSTKYVLAKCQGATNWAIFIDPLGKWYPLLNKYCLWDWQSSSMSPHRSPINILSMTLRGRRKSSLLNELRSSISALTTKEKYLAEFSVCPHLAKVSRTKCSVHKE